MSMRKNVIGIISVVPLPEGYEAVCPHCKTVLGKGLFAIGITDDDGQYFVEHNPPLECTGCTEEKNVPLLYMNLYRAVRNKNRIKASVESRGTLRHLKLQIVPDVMRWTSKH